MAQKRAASTPEKAVKKPATEAKAKPSKKKLVNNQVDTFSKVAEKSNDDKPWQIKKGQVLNPKGRPKGTRNKLTQDFVAAMCEDFRQHGAAVVEKVRTEKPDVYLRVIAGLVPQQVEVGEAGAFSDLSDDELDITIARMSSQLAELNASLH